MITPDDFRSLALAMPEASQGGHFDVTDFRVRGRIFATWRSEPARAVVKLTPDDQQLALETMPGSIRPVSGAWGRKGWSQIDLEAIGRSEAEHLMRLAWRSVAPKTLVKTSS